MVVVAALHCFVISVSALELEKNVFRLSIFEKEQGQRRRDVSHINEANEVGLCLPSADLGIAFGT
jgi:hypothetical protein